MPAASPISSSSPPTPITIYPEFMPDRVRRVRSGHAWIQLLEYLKTHSRIETVDLRPALRKAKSIEKVYYQTDTHWNDFGGYIAVREILTAAGRLVPGARPLPFSRFRFDFTERKTGDLSLLVGLDQTGPWERVPILVADPPFSLPEALTRSPSYLYGLSGRSPLRDCFCAVIPFSKSSSLFSPR